MWVSIHSPSQQRVLTHLPRDMSSQQSKVREEGTPRFAFLAAAFNVDLAHCLDDPPLRESYKHRNRERVTTTYDKSLPGGGCTSTRFTQNLVLQRVFERM